MTLLNRRNFIQSSVTAAALSGIPSGLTASHRSGEGNIKKPNILVILVDDLGFGDLNCYGANDLHTPHIDQLRHSGMKFTNAYANCPVCSPTRAALLSGRYQEFVGVPGVIRTHYNNSWGHLTSDSKLLPEFLKPAGYHTAIIGKWHLGLQSPNKPNERGFDFFHGFLGDMMDDYYTHLRHGENYMRHNEEVIEPEGHATDLFSQWACDYLQKANEANEDQPFFLYLSYNAPHTPVQPPKDWLEQYKKRNPLADNKRAELAAFIEHLDHGIGTVMQTLQKTGLDENTLVIFASDNGGLLRVDAYNGPYRNGKGTVYEGGIRVPMCAAWKNKIQPGTTTNTIALSMDIMPTVLEAAGVKIEHQIEGKSFLHTLLHQEEKEETRDLFWGRKEGGNFNGERIDAIRRGEWKLLRPMPDEALELYNLKSDPYETTNLAKSHPQKFQELKSALDAQLERYKKVPWQPPRVEGIHH